MYRKTIRHLLELIRFSHTLFALPFALLAAVMAWRLQYIDQFVKTSRQAPTKHFRELIGGVVQNLGDYLDSPLIGKSQGFAIRWQEIVGILLCMVTARSFAMAFNRLADRHIDATNPRTAGRHLPAGILSVPQVTAFAAYVRSASSQARCCFCLTAAADSFGSRTRISGRLQLHQAIHVARSFLARASLALSPIAAWIAIRGEVVLAHPADLLPALVLGGAVLTWVAGFDIIYACQDYDVDRRRRLPQRSGAVRNSGALRLAAVCHLATIVFLACLPLVYPFFGWIYWLAVAGGRGAC